MPAGPALRFDDVGLRRGDRHVLSGITWTVEHPDRWVILGPNGSGKTTLLQLATGHLHPSSGTVDVLGHRLGRVDVRHLRTRIGLVSGAVTRMLRPGLTAAEIVITGRHAALEPWWHDYTPEDHARARSLLDQGGLAAAIDRPFGVLSEGERQQVLLARAVMGRPELLIFDEPAAGLDLGARERLLRRMEQVALDPASPPSVFVTHHVEEIPTGFDRALLLREGKIVAAGSVEHVVSDDNLTKTFDLDVTVRRSEGRYTARAVR